MPRNMDDSDNYITRRLSEQRMQAQPVQAMPVGTGLKSGATVLHSG